MKQFIILVFSSFLTLQLSGQNIHSSAPQVVSSTPDINTIEWWGCSSDFATCTNSIDEMELETEVCPNAVGDTLIFSHFNFESINLTNSLIRLDITKRRVDFSDIRDAYLAVVYQGQIISENLADTINSWPVSDSTTSYIIDQNALLVNLDTAVLNDPTFGFMYWTNFGDPWCMNVWINAVSLNIEQTTNVRTLSRNLEVLDISPNPSSGIFRIASIDSNYEELQMKLYDLNGMEIRSSLIRREEPLEIDLSDHADGMYLIRLFDGKGQELAQSKLIKQ